MKQKISNIKPRVRAGFHLIRSRTIFAKYMITCVSVIMLGFLLLGTAVIVLSVTYSNQDRESINQSFAQNISKRVTDYLYFLYSPGSDSRFAKQMQNDVVQYEHMATAQTGAIVCVAKTDGSLLTFSTNDPDDISGNIPESIMKSLPNSLDKKGYSEIGTLGGFFRERYSTVGVPIIYNNAIVGAVFVSSPANSLMGYMYNIIRIFLLSIALTIFVTFILLYFLTAKMVRPLRQMSNAAKSFSKGDFTVRVPVANNDEIGQLAVAFNNMASSLTTLEETRRSFVANVSHELKTPMTSIAGFIDGILDGTIPSAKQEYYLSIVSNEVKRLSRLVRSFLEISRIEAGELKITPSRFSLTETVRRVVVGFEYAINDKQLEVRGLDTDKEYYAFADPDIIHQVIYNLVDNAIKFSDTGGYLEVNVAGTGDKIYVGVKNSGMGIPAEDLPYVFDRFYKTDKSRSSDRKGVGLGLYIVKTVLNMQEQDISVKSVEGEYCEFVFTLAKA